MCKVIEDMLNEIEIETRLSNLKKIADNLNFTFEQALDALEIPVSDRQLYINKLQ